MSVEKPSGKVQPHSAEAERSVLGALLLDGERIPEVAEVLEPADFFSKRHSILFEVLQSLASDGVPVDFVSVGEALRAGGRLESVGGHEFLVELADSVTSAAHLAHHVKIVEQTALLRRLIRECTAVIGEAYEARPGSDAVEELLDQAENRIYQVSRGSERSSADLIRDILGTAMEEITARARHGNMTGLPTRFHELDPILGGLNKGDFIILAARPSMGKTALALNIIERVLLDPPEGSEPRVLLFSLEMGKEQLVKRMIFTRARVEAWKQKSDGIPEEDFLLLHEAVQELSQTHLYVDDTPGMTVMGMRARARRLKSRVGLDLVVVDYLQLMHHPKAESRQMEISQISRALKGLARELDVPVIALAQLSRQVELREPPIPQLADLRESGSIEQDADVVLLLNRLERYHKYAQKIADGDPDYQKYKNSADVIVAKHRNGATGRVTLRFFGEYMRFEDPTVGVSEAIHAAPEAFG